MYIFFVAAFTLSDILELGIEEARREGPSSVQTLIVISNYPKIVILGD
jgi:hypothetical protein